MGLRDVALRVLRVKPEEQRAISVPWDVGGPTRSGSVSAEQALSLIPVFAAVRLLASQVASLPLQAYRKSGDGRIRIPAPSLFVNPSVQGTLYDWLHRAVTSLALRGNAYGLITQRDRDQYPTMIEWLHPDDVFVDDRQASGPGSFANPTWYWQGRIIPAEDLLHIPWFTVPGRVQGLSPIGACAVTVSTGISAQNYTSDWFDNGAVPPGEFKNTEKKVDQAEADIISARLNNAIRRRKPLVYGADWEYKPISVSAHEAKFVETLKMNATQIAAVYGIPPEMIGGEAGGPLTYNTVEQNSLNFLKFTLRPWLELLEAAFYRLSPRPQYVKFNIDALLRSDLTTRMQAYQIARSIGKNSINEIRALEDEQPIPSGDDYTPLEVLAKQQTPAPTTLRAEVIDVQPIEPARFADPGYQRDRAPRYPIDSAAHIRASWDGIHQAGSAARYTPVQLAQIKADIRAASRRLGQPLERNLPAAEALLQLTARRDLDAAPGGPESVDDSHLPADWTLSDDDPLELEGRAAKSAAGLKGAAQLHEYWTKGEGLAKWADSPHPWTALYHHLLKYLPPAKAKRTASQWFHDVFGFWPGSDLNRVTHGKPPRGDKIGPG